MDLSILKTVGITFVAAGMIFAFGLVILDKLYTTATYEDRTVTTDTFTMPTDEGNITLDHTDLISFTSITNSTGAIYPAANYTVTLATGIVQVHENASVCKTGATCTAAYIYREYETTAGLAVTATKTALGEIPNNWFVIIAVVIAGVIVLGIVLKGLGQAGNR